MVGKAVAGARRAVISVVVARTVGSRRAGDALVPITIDSGVFAAASCADIAVGSDGRHADGHTRRGGASSWTQVAVATHSSRAEVTSRAIKLVQV